MGCVLPMLAGLVILTLAACLAPDGPATVQPTPKSSGQLAAEAICAGTTYTRCVEDVLLSTTLDPGGLGAICQYGQSEGDVVLVDSNEDAVTQCATNSDPSSTVFKVFTIPGTPPPTEAPTPVPLAMKATSLTQAVARGGTAKVAIKTAAKADCSITVSYDSGYSQAAGLRDKTADAAGKVSWSWEVGLNTAKGTYPIDIVCYKGDRSGYLGLDFRVK